MGIRRTTLAFLPLSLLSLSIVAQFAGAQSNGVNEWTWMNGSSSVPSLNGGQPGVYGNLGVSADANVPGGRFGGASWTDMSGNLWLFGGYGFDRSGTQGELNDLWQFSLATQEWTWIGGSSTVPAFDQGQPGVYGTQLKAAPSNIPGGRDSAVSWIDKSGNLWLFGGYGFDSAGIYGYLNDLWKFNSSTRQWAWMGGRSTVPGSLQGQAGVYGVLATPAVGNIPGGRWGAVNWTDSKGNLWLLGGFGADFVGTEGVLNDLWKFNPSTMEWTWIGGSETIPTNSEALSGVYGTLRNPAAGNVPGGRKGAVSWIDGSDNLWLFGGYGFDSAGAWGELNDLWEFLPSLSEWVWIGGSSTIPPCQSSSYPLLCGGQPGSYGALQTPSPSNVPGSRAYAVGWTASDGSLWLFGGYGLGDTLGIWADLNDLWRFNPITNEWTWMGGTGSMPCENCALQGQYGTLKTPAFGNAPGGRQSATGWIDSRGNLWLFGGYGLDDTPATWGSLNDLWNFQLDTGGLPVTARPTFSPDSGTYLAVQSVTIADSTPGSSIYYTINGSLPAILYTGAITVSSSERIQAFAVASGYSNSAASEAIYTLTLPQAAPPTFSLSPGKYPSAQTVVISDATPGSTIYYTSNGTPTTASNIYSGPITISASRKISAIAVATGFSQSAIASAEYTIQPTPALGLWAWMSGSLTLPTCAAQQFFCGQSGVYGTLRAPSATNVPGGRFNAASWTDKNDNLWLFGGLGFDSTGKRDWLNDLWEFTPSTRQWTWVAGDSTIGTSIGRPGVYGTIGVASPGNIPGSRSGAATWTDASGNFWLFGGEAIDANGTQGWLNDLWKFDPSTKVWVWKSGNSAVAAGCQSSSPCGQPGVYGASGSPSGTNTPGGRDSAVSWIDVSGNLWLFGGYGFDSTSTWGWLNDLWEFNPSTSEWTWISGSKTLQSFNYVGLFGTLTYGQRGVYGGLGVPAPVNTPGSRGSSVSWIDKSGNLWLLGGYGFDHEMEWGYLNDLWEFNPSTKEWTWMGGFNHASKVGAESPIFGTEGAASSANVTGARSSSSASTAADGRFWLFGGEGVSESVGFLNDLWVFDPVSNQWTWMGGSTGAGDLGVYGTLGVPEATNIPSGRSQASNWIDHQGNLWFFGGTNLIQGGLFGSLNDLWEYMPPASVLTPAAMPTFSPNPAAYTTAQSVVISDTTPNATIYYTTDGTAPSTTSTVYTSPISVMKTQTIEAVATATGYSQSALATATYTISILAPAFTISGTSVSVAPGATTGNTSTITVTPTGGFTGNVTLTAALTSSPAGAQHLPTFSFSSTSPVSVADANVAKATLTISTTPATNATLVYPKRYGVPLFAAESATLACVLLFGIPGRRRGWRNILAAMFLLVTLTCGVPACGGGGGTGSGSGGGGSSNPGTTSGTYIVTITGTSGGTIASTTVTLKVQ
jgi:N-acetylneuraminic acid mutarotase